MKICLQCGSSNKEDAKFCNKCGAALETVPHTREEAKKLQNQQKQPEKSPKKKSNKWLIIILIIIILVLLFIIGCVLGKSTGSSLSSSSTKKTPVKQSSVLTQQQKQAVQSKEENKTDNQNNLTVKELTPQQTATAIAYYENGNPVAGNGMNSAAWNVVQGSNTSHQVAVFDNDSENITEKGAGVSYGYDAQIGGKTEYTLSDNGQTVNIYEIGDDPYADSNDDQSPTQTVSLQAVVNYINQQKAAQTVRNVAQGVKIVDNRKQKLNTKKLSKNQLKDWALQTFRNTYSDSAMDDLSAEYLGIDSDDDAEVIVHDNDNSDMDTTYRVNSNGELQEQDGSDWTTVSTSFSE